MRMSPKTFLIATVAAFLALSAATLAYFLPRLHAEPLAREATTTGTQVQETPDNAEHVKPDIDQALLQSIPAHPEEIVNPSESPTKNAAAPSPAAPTSEAKSAASTPAPDLISLLKQPRIQFEVASATLTPSSRQYLDEVVGLLKSQPHLHLSIEGHTDSQDRLGKNQSLSEARALAVMNYLAGKGIDRANLHSAGFGGSRPIADNDTPAGRAKNRRIEFVLG